MVHRKFCLKTFVLNPLRGPLLPARLEASLTPHGPWRSIRAVEHLIVYEKREHFFPFFRSGKRSAVQHLALNLFSSTHDTFGGTYEANATRLSRVNCHLCSRLLRSRKASLEARGNHPAARTQGW